MILPDRGDDGNSFSGRATLDLLVGIVSFGDRGQCGQSEKPGVYTSVSYFRGWIDSVMSGDDPSEIDAGRTESPEQSEDKDSNESEEISPTDPLVKVSFLV